jgi:hypothetical protein
MFMVENRASLMAECSGCDLKIVRYDVEIVDYDPENTVRTSARF